MDSYLTNLNQQINELFEPNLRIAITGLSTSGKTVFITSLIDNLLYCDRMNLLSAYSEGRIKRIALKPQPDDNIARFPYEECKAALLGKNRKWPKSTRNISQLRLSIEFEPLKWIDNSLLSKGGKLNIDIVDYPGEWILDLVLMRMNYVEWSDKIITKIIESGNKNIYEKWLSYIKEIEKNDFSDHSDAEIEKIASKASTLFTKMLKNFHGNNLNLAGLMPGRFLLPGDLEGSPALSFCPLLLNIVESKNNKKTPIFKMMERRFNSYKKLIIKPFFKEHFQKIDRQIILIDLFKALNLGEAAIDDMVESIEEILKSFKPGRNNILTKFISPKIDKIAFCATKADLLHVKDHDKLAELLDEVVSGSALKAEEAKANYEVFAISAIRSTSQVKISHNNLEYDCLVGVPEKGEVIANKEFDGKSEHIIFTGSLPDNIRDYRENFQDNINDDGYFKSIKFRPPLSKNKNHEIEIDSTSFPHIRLDKLIEFLIGDKLI